ncbi:hypothetical protein ACODT5_00205 [Streptomyces sp. 5.8]|uniref:hypothetical protein n=1 Tax=Streptomyces sp. 5.8 TaxID=3406571 RepID=UPI003BB6630F
MHRTALRSITTAGAISAALILTGCGDADLDHGKVVEKRVRPAAGPIYENVERPAACRSARSQTSRTTLSRPNPPKPRPRTDTSKPKPKPQSNPSRGDASKQTPPHSAPGPSTPGKNDSSAPCGMTAVPVFKGYRTPAKWELKLQDGNETGWETVTPDEYDSVEVGDHF